MGRTNYTQEQDDFLKDNIHTCYTLYDLTDDFNNKFPEHVVTYTNLQKHLSILGLKKGTHNIRKHRVHSTNSIGTLISDKYGRKCRIKTDKGYISANTYFKKLYWGCVDSNMYIVHLDGDYTNYNIEDIQLVDKYVYSALHWRKWIFTDKELTKTAILTIKLLRYFPELSKNENQYYRSLRVGEE